MQISNSQNLNFLLKGTNGKAVLFIHGITGTPSEMRYVASKIHKAGYTVLCSVLPRHCSSLVELKKVTWQEIYRACEKDLRELKKGHSKVFVGGLSMGALEAMHLAYNNPGDVSGIIALAPTFFYDGWAQYKGRFLLEFVWLIPFLRNKINVRESWPYGLKDEYLRDKIHAFYSKAKAEKFDDKVSSFGSPFFPIACLYQGNLIKKVVSRELPLIKAPIIIIHAKDDDMTSFKNAEFVYNRVGSSVKKLVPLENSYHMITIDNDRELVAREAVSFIDRV